MDTKLILNPSYLYFILNKIKEEKYEITFNLNLVYHIFLEFNSLLENLLKF